MIWFVHPVDIERLTGRSSTGPTFAAATSEVAAVDDTRKLVRNAAGDEIVASSTVFLPGDIDAVPVGSRITLPAAYDGRTSHVLAVSRHDSGGVVPIPPYLELALQ